MANTGLIGCTPLAKLCYLRRIAAGLLARDDVDAHSGMAFSKHGFNGLSHLLITYSSGGCPGFAPGSLLLRPAKQNEPQLRLYSIGGNIVARWRYVRQGLTALIPRGIMIAH